MWLLTEQISASATGQKELQSFPSQWGKWGFSWVTGKCWEHDYVKSLQLCHLPCPKNFHKLLLSRNLQLSLPPIFSLQSENAQMSALLSPYCIISQVCQIDEVGFTTGLFLHTDWSISFVISNLAIKRNSPKYKHTTLLLFLSCQERACSHWRPQIKDLWALNSEEELLSDKDGTWACWV